MKCKKVEKDEKARNLCLIIEGRHPIMDIVSKLAMLGFTPFSPVDLLMMGTDQLIHIIE